MQKFDCDADYSDWPFDSHKCQIPFRTMYMYEDVVFDPDNVAGEIVKNTNMEWKISSMTGRIDVQNKSSIRFTINIERYNGLIYKHVIVPIYCLIAFTLAILWMKPENFWRLLFCGFNIYLHFGLMDRVWWQFPSNGASQNIPKILKYMLFMLIISTLILIESILLKVITARCSVPPPWTKKVVKIFDDNSVIKKYVILSQPEEIKEDMKNDENETSNELMKNDKNVMESFNRIIDRALFLLFSTFYLIYNVV